MTSIPLAHGLGEVRDLPVPGWLFLWGAAVVLVASFAALAALWPQPLLERAADGRPLPRWIQRLVLGPELRLLLGAASAALLGLVLAAAAVGDDSINDNIAPTFVYVLFWLGLVPIVVVLGDVWRAVNPWRATIDAIAWVAERIAPPWTAPARYPERLGVWPAAVLLFAFATLELAYPHGAEPNTLAIAIAVYTSIMWFGCSLFGRAWLDGGDAFTVYFGLLARLSPFAVRAGGTTRTVVARPPLTGLAGGDGRPGIVALVAVMLGSVAFDGFSRTEFWRERAYAVQTSFPLGEETQATLALTALNTVGMLGTVAAVAGVYLVAVEAARILGRTARSAAEAFVGSLVPIALAYVVAHYFSLFVLQGQAARRLVSDPFGYGWDLFGTADFQPQLDLLTPNTVWCVQVAVLVVGHVLGLVLAHDRALVLFRRDVVLRTQAPMLALMIGYTVGGLWLLASE